MNGKIIIFGLLGGLLAASLLHGKNETTPDNTNTQTSDYDFSTDDIKEARSTRNNNPGNVKKPGNTDWQGTKSYDEKGHAIFHDYIWGTRAMITDLRTKIQRGVNTPSKIIKEYCPATGSDKCIDQKAYIKYLEDNVGKNTIGRNDKETLYKLVQYMAFYEAGNYPNTSTNRTKLNRAIFDMAWEILNKKYGQ